MNSKSPEELPMPVANKKLLHEVFDQTAEQHCQRPAVVGQGGETSYGQLRADSDQIARALLQSGLTPGQVVGIYLDKSHAFITAMLGIMKSGGIFMALDPDFPEARTRQMLNAAPPARFLTTEAHLAGLKSLRGEDQFDYLLLNRGGRLQNSDVDDQPLSLEEKPDLKNDDGVYIVYTSGSTGEPKGILGQHQALSHFIHWEAKALEFTENDRVSQFPPITFDACFKDIFTPLIRGGRVCLPEPDLFRATSALVDYLEQHQITVMQCVPSIYRMIIRELEQRQGDLLPHLRQIVVAGEPFYGRDVRRWRERMGDGTAIANLYGLTETTILKTYHQITETPGDKEMIHVGQPISNTAILILKGDRLCNIGELGEVYIKSPFITKGYLNEAQTRERFVVNPLTKHEDDIIFRTGDMGRYKENRDLELLGRMDTQVKVGGARIELGEIEACAADFEALDQVVVVAHKDSHGDRGLACYYTEKTPTDAEAVRAYLADRLPSYMIPGFFLKMDRFPLNINGKVNRKALPKPEQLIHSGSAYQAPETDTEKLLEDIWREVLALEKVGLDLSFFEAGGHSLKATRILSRIFQARGIEISLQDFFRNDTIRELAKIVDQNQGTTGARIPKAAAAELYPVSPAQRRLWILDQIDENRIAYSMPGAYLFTGDLNFDPLREAFQQLAKRHESLRTAIVREACYPKQRILENVALDIELVQEPVPEGEDLETIVSNFAAREARIPFDLEQAPLWRIRVLALDSERHIVFFNIHHIIGDGLSMDILGREWIETYRALTQGGPPHLPETELQYKDYASWLLDNFENGRRAELEAFWTSQFSDGVPVLELPTDFPRPSVPSYEGATLVFDLDHDHAANWRRFSENNQVSLFQSLLALSAVLLSRYSGQEDMILGTPVSGRTHHDLEHLVGFFVNTLALRFQIEPSTDFGHFLQQVKTRSIAAYDHQDYSFDELVDQLKVPRQTARAPLFDVLVALESLEAPHVESGDLSIREIIFDSGTTRYDLTLVFVEDGADLKLKINYSTDLFKPDRIRRLASHINTLMGCILERPQTPIARLNLLSAEEENLIFHQFPGPDREYPLDSGLVTLLSAGCNEYPERTAVVHEGRALNYGELWEQSGRYASALLDAGLQIGEPVGLLVDRGLESVLGFIAIQRAGGTFLPLDPFYPEERLAYMIEQARCRHIIASQKHRHLAGTQAALLDPQTMCESNIRDLPTLTKDLCPAIIFTSGSTGKPKGIRLSQKGLINTAYSLIENYQIQAHDRVLQFASYSFDIFPAEVLSALLAGACLVVADRNRIDDPQSFCDYLNRREVSVGSMPTAYLNALDKNNLPPLRVVITGGEAPSVDMAQTMARRGRYFNGYGLTEASGYSTVFQVDAEQSYPMGIPIGKALPNTACFVLDGNLQPQPIGIPGQICIEGVGLSQGYLNDPEKTAATFVPSPFHEGERLLLSGDLGVFDEEGRLRFLGRADKQVKIRGHRIEPGEIERALQQHPDIKEAFVTKHEAAGELAAYYIGSRQPSRAEFNQYLGQTLPSFMIPAFFIAVDRFPLSKTGKIEAHKLPDPRLDKSAAKDDARAPRSGLEQQIAAMWAQSLNLDQVAANHNFFALGGTSIGLVSLIAKLREAFGKNISVKDILTAPTVAEQAALIEKKQGRSVTAGPIHQTPEGEDIIQDSRGQGHVRAESRSLLNLIACGILEPVQAVAIDAFDDSLPENVGLSAEVLSQRWCGDMPVLTAIREMPEGRIGLIILPITAARAFEDQARLRDLLNQAVNLAQTLGANHISLTGMLPEAAAKAFETTTLPAPFTARAAVAASNILNFQQLLEQTGRDIEEETLALIGGDPLSIATLGTLLTRFPHPESLIISSRHHGDESELFDKIRDHWGFRGDLDILPVNGEVHDAVYDAGIFLLCRQQPLDIQRLAPGSLLLVESGNHLIDRDSLSKRIREKGDLLVSEGDVLVLPKPAPTTLYMPDTVRADLPADIKKELFNRDPKHFTGCVSDSLIAAVHGQAQPKLDPETVALYLETLVKWQAKPAPFHLKDEAVGSEHVAVFRERFGRARINED